MPVNIIRDKIKKIFLLMIFGAFDFSLGRFASADLTNPLKSTTFADLVANIAKIVAQIGFPIAVMALLWAGFLFVTARGNEEQLSKAKTTLLWAVIGTAILLGAWGIATAVSSFIGTL